MKPSRAENVANISTRKDDHIRINLNEDVRSGITTGLEDIRLVHNALPDTNFSQIDPSITFLGKRMRLPLLISSMTGGTETGENINRLLASAAENYGLAMGVGSQRIVLDDPGVATMFNIRKYAPGILLFANIGAVQLNYGYSVEHCHKAVESIQADGLILHLNPLQEALQDNGNTDFSGILRKIESITSNLGKPVIVKEVGWGISSAVALQLKNAGVSAIDVAGAGGTSWSQVEMHRAPDALLERTAASFLSWGIPTVQSIRNVVEVAPGIPVIASGGLRNGIDLAKCIALGASLGGIAGHFLRAAAISSTELELLIEQVRSELLISMFVTGSKNLDELHNASFQ